MKHIFTIIAIILTTVTCAQQPASPNLVGKTFAGIQDSTQFQPGCEGCGNAGFFTFQSVDQVEFLLPGSDIMELASYKQVGRWVYINDLKLKFNASADTLIEQLYQTPFVLQKKND